MENFKTEHSYSIFLIGNKILAINVENVIKVMLDKKINPIPKDKNYIEGIINFDGTIVTIIDICKKFDFFENNHENETILILNYNKNTINYQLGILINKVLNIKTITNKEILPTPYFENKTEAELFTSTFKYEKEFVFVLDIEKIFF